MDDPFTEAQKNKGKHHGFYLRYQNEPTSFIRRGIRSLDQQIARHEEKLREQNSLLRQHWQDELANFREQKAILERILEQRHERGD